MIERFIEKSVDKLTKQDIIDFANKNNVYLTKEQADYIYAYIKQNWKEALYEPENKLIDRLSFLDVSTKEKALELLRFYRKKYKNFLN